ALDIVLPKIADTLAALPEEDVNAVADAYERLLLETMRGIQALFVRRDEVEEAWKWVDSITEAWAADRDAPKPYQARTWGP
ncbi:hypothetical protein Q6252_28930, partial [Klebsiella pneumoniae]|nr:hypothetical protein [Klebsiella pneumoniae]